MPGGPIGGPPRPMGGIPGGIPIKWRDVFHNIQFL